MSDELIDGRGLRRRKPRYDEEADEPTRENERIVPLRPYQKVDPPSHPYVRLEPPSEAGAWLNEAASEPVEPEITTEAEQTAPPDDPPAHPGLKPDTPPGEPSTDRLMRLPRIKDEDTPPAEPLSSPSIEPRHPRRPEPTTVSKPTDELPRPTPPTSEFIPNFETGSEEVHPIPAETPSGALLPRVRFEPDDEFTAGSEVVTGEFLETAEKIPTAAFDLHMGNVDMLGRRLPRARRPGGTTYQFTAAVYEVVRTQKKKIAIIAAVLVIVMAVILVPESYRAFVPSRYEPGAPGGIGAFFGGLNGPPPTLPAGGMPAGLRITISPTGVPTPLPGHLQGRVAFASNRDGDFDIYVRDMLTGAEHAVTDNPSADRSPAWSPDGTRIVFVSNAQGTDNLYVANADGSGLTRITDGGAQDHAPTWSPNGNLIVFSREQITGSRLMALDTQCIPGAAAACEAALRPILEERYDLHPAWRPDGALIAFAASDIPGQPLRLATVGADGQGFAMLGGTGSSDYTPAWSPDGTRIAFASFVEGDDDLWIMQVDGSGLAQVTMHEDIDGHPAWSPDGQHLLFTSDRSAAGDFELYLMRATCPAGDQTCENEAQNLSNNPGDDLDPAWTVHR